MNPFVQEFPQLGDYFPALLSVSVLCLAVLTQGFLTAPLAFIKGEQTPGAVLHGDHELFSFRVLRTYSNSVESLPAFGVALIVASLIGVNASIVNWLAVLHVGFRLGFWAFYYSGVGKVAGGPRTLCFVGGLITNLVMAGACVYRLIF